MKFSRRPIWVYRPLSAEFFEGKLLGLYDVIEKCSQQQPTQSGNEALAEQALGNFSYGARYMVTAFKKALEDTLSARDLKYLFPEAEGLEESELEKKWKYVRQTAKNICSRAVGTTRTAIAGELVTTQEEEFPDARNVLQKVRKKIQSTDPNDPETLKPTAPIDLPTAGKALEHFVRGIATASETLREEMLSLAEGNKTLKENERDVLVARILPLSFQKAFRDVSEIVNGKISEIQELAKRQEGTKAITILCDTIAARINEMTAKIAI